MVVDHEDPALPVEPAVRAENEVVGPVVGVGGVEAVQDNLADVRHVIAIGVLEEDEVRAGGDEHAPVPELEAEGVLDAGELRGAIGAAVPVVVVEDEQGIAHRLERLPHRVGGPDGGPEAAAGIDLQLHRVDERREAVLRREHVGREPVREREML